MADLTEKIDNYLKEGAPVVSKEYQKAIDGIEDIINDLKSMSTFSKEGKKEWQKMFKIWNEFLTQVSKVEDLVV